MRKELAILEFHLHCMGFLQQQRPLYRSYSHIAHNKVEPVKDSCYVHCAVKIRLLCCKLIETERMKLHRNLNTTD